MGGDQQHQPKVEIQEKGDILFLYRPKVEKEEAHSSDDVQRLYMVLKPSGDEIKQELGVKSSNSDAHEDTPSTTQSKKRKFRDIENPTADAQQDAPSTTQYQPLRDTAKTGSQEVNIKEQMLMRLIVMGRKSLPDVHSPKNKSRRRPYWGFVELVTTKIDDLKNALKGGEYDTSTRGHRHNPPSRALGEGIYQILRHINPGGKNKKAHTHLIYKLRFPPPTHAEVKHEKEEGPPSSSPQESLHVEREASYLIQIKNPSTGGGGNFRGLQSNRRAKFPAHLEEKFGKLRYSPADPTDFLNYEGCEFLLIAASDDISEELGLELKTKECEVPDEAAAATKACSCSDLLKTFGESSSALPSSSIAPLLKGTWA